MSALLETTDISLALPVDGRPRRILRSVSLSIQASEAVALVGESGSGKSMTARTIARLLPPHAVVTGSVRFADQSVLDLRGAELQRYRQRQVAMIFQDPRASINPVHTIGDFLTESLRVLDHTPKTEARRRALQVLDEVGIDRGEQRLRSYPHELSGGMLQRVMIAAALLSDAELILADEPTTALDVTTQAEVLAILDELRRDRGLSLLFISHDLELATAICEQIYVMYAGEVVETQPANSIEHQPMHPYTRGLFAARPSLHHRVARLTTIAGRPRSADETPDGCAFRDRCAFAEAVCETDQTLQPRADGLVRCCRADDLPAPTPELTSTNHD